MEENFDAALLLGKRVDTTHTQPVINQTLRIAMYEEYRKYEMYKKAIEQFGFVTPFTNIIAAKEQHLVELNHLLQRYQVALPTNDWAQKVTIPDTLKEAYEIGVGAELESIGMYSHLVEYSENEDIKDVFFRLQAASYNNHLPTFRTHLENALQNSKEAKDGISQEAIMQKVNEWSELAQKIASNEVSQAEISKLFQNVNLSFIGGLLLGGVGASILAQIVEDKENEEE
jgi:rubrerythrin